MAPKKAEKNPHRGVHQSDDYRGDQRRSYSIHLESRDQVSHNDQTQGAQQPVDYQVSHQEVPALWGYAIRGRSGVSRRYPESLVNTVTIHLYYPSILLKAGVVPMIKVSDWMSKGVLAVGPSDSIAVERQIMPKHRINQIPLVEGEKLVGIVTD